MLKLAQTKDLDAVLSVCDGDLLGTRIGCYALAYGFARDFLQIWIDSETDTAIAKFYDSITLKTESDDIAEISDFIRMIGFDTLETDLETCRKLGYENYIAKKAYVFSGVSQQGEAVDLGEEYYKKLYSLVCENIPGSFSSDAESYYAFLSDFTFRKRRNLARCKGIISEGNLLSSVVTAAETGTSALISAVACDKNTRGQGLGKKTVMSMVNELVSENKKVFVIALNESAQGFYEHLGFEYYDNIAIIKQT